MSENTRKRRWWRFSLRTLFVMMTLAGCWLGYGRNWVRQRSEAIQAIQASGGVCWFSDHPRIRVSYLRSIFADRAVASVLLPRGCTAADAERIHSFFSGNRPG